MGFTKNKAWSIVIALILIIVFNVIMFMLPLEHGVLFWMGYSFEIFSIIFLLSVSLVLLNKSYINDKFHGLPVLSIGWLYFVIQTGLSVKQMTSVEFPYTYGIIFDVVLAAAASILLILTFAAGREIRHVEKEINEKVSYIRNLRADIELINVKDVEAANAINKLAEAVRFSDPMSHSLLSDIEHKIIEKFYVLKDNTDNASMVIAVCGDMQQLLKGRNEKCKALKNVQGPQREKDNSGGIIISGAFGIISIAILIALTICFVFIPNSKYNEAMVLYAQQRYDEAITAFSKLGNYKDSTYKIAEINEKIDDETYTAAESYYKEQNYVEALKLYSKLDDYKNSKDRIEQIYNKFATGGEIYFGTYKGNTIPWKILKTEQSRMLLITENPIEVLAFNNELKNITYETSSIRTWLNNDFLTEFSDEQKSRILKSEDELNDDIFILSEEEYKGYAETISFNTISDWWLRTKTDSGMMYVYGENSEVNTYGESVVRVMGVRPCVWINLK